MYVKGGHNLITPWSTYSKIVTFFSARVTCPLHPPCASVRPSEKRKKLRLFCRVTRNSRAWTICMEKNWLRNENWQNVNSCLLLTFLAITRTTQFYCAIYSRRLSPCEMRMYILTSWSLAFHQNGFLSGIFLTAETSLTTTSDVHLSIQKLAWWICAISL